MINHSVLNAKQKQLLKLFKQLNSEQQDFILSFILFLSQKKKDEPVLSKPQMIARPANESVIAAMRRLRKTYPMLDQSVLLDQASALMSAHILQGRSAQEVIDDLEKTVC